MAHQLKQSPQWGLLVSIAARSIGAAPIMLTWIDKETPVFARCLAYAWLAASLASCSRPTPLLAPTTAPSATATPTPISLPSATSTRTASPVPSGTATATPLPTRPPTAVPNTVTPIATGLRLWTRGAPSPKARLELGVVALNGRIYAVGGADSRFRPLTDVLVYDPAADVWSTAAPLPEPRHHLGIAELEGKIYVVGGYSGPTAHNDAWVYDPASDAWSPIARLPRSQAAHALVPLDGKLYLVGGNLAPFGAPQGMFVYDPRTDTWDQSRAPLPTGREHLAAVAAEGRLFVIGGRVEFGPNLPVVDIYNPATDAWTPGPDLPMATSGMTAGVLGREIHVIGGENLADFSIVTAHQVLDLNTLTWSEWVRPPVSRHGLGSAVVNGQWFVINGGPTADVSVSNWVNVFTP